MSGTKLARSDHPHLIEFVGVVRETGIYFVVRYTGRLGDEFVVEHKPQQAGKQLVMNEWICGKCIYKLCFLEHG